jgi:hypothetical protein
MHRVLRTPLPDSHGEALDLMALCAGRSRAAVVRLALEQYIPTALLDRARAATTRDRYVGALDTAESTP